MYAYQMTMLLIKDSLLHCHDFSLFINRENNIRKVEKPSHLNSICW